VDSRTEEITSCGDDQRAQVEGAVAVAAPLAALVTHLADAPEKSLLNAVASAEESSQPVRLRTSLQLWNYRESQYRGWRGQTWVVTLAGLAEVRKAQAVIELIFDLIAGLGVEKTLVMLEGLKRREL
jgi:hypothetical protein